jgi:predicted TIM-barrel fold metal-dependent hydrolase
VSGVDYRLISADGHFCEPGDLWTARVEKKYQDRVPRIISFPQGDGWIYPGVHEEGMPFGWRSCAGRPAEDMGPWVRMEEIAKGCYEPAARVAEMLEDGIDAEVLFDSNGPCTYVTGEKDRDLHLAMVRAYNDWVSDFCAHDPARLGGTALIPSSSVEDALVEMKRVSNMPGFVAWRLRCYANGTTQIEAEDDAIWAAVVDSPWPLTIHVGLGNSLPRKQTARSLPGTGHFYDAPTRMLEFIFTGVLDRFPSLKIALTEVDAGWIPYFEEQADDNYMRHSKSSLRDAGLTKMPSRYMREHFTATFITDSYALKNRHRIGIERMLWSNDYPHITSDWPNSWKTINATFADIPDDERDAILFGNSLALFPFPGSRTGSAAKSSLAGASA